MFAVVRTLVYATIFIGLLLVFVPAGILGSAGIAPPATSGTAQIAAMAMVVVGVGLALWCALTFAIIGKGTPAPFDPPRHLVVRGPYRFVRNPMYIGAATALVGVALYYGSAGLWLFAALFIVAIHLFILFYEEPTLRRLFGDDYVAYSDRVRRYWPVRRRR